MVSVKDVLFALMLASADELYRQGIEAFQAGRHDAAIVALTEASKAAPRNAQTWKALGVVHASRSDYERADQPFERACSLAPDLVDACYYYGRNLYAMNRFEPSLAALRKALPKDRRPWLVHLGIAQALEALGRDAEAAREFDVAVRTWSAAPRDARGTADYDPRMHQAVFLFRQGKVADALGPARAAVADFPSAGRPRFELGRVLYQLGELETAAAELEKAVAYGHGSPAHLLLGKTYLRLGRAADAEKHLAAGR
jgi:tetratricopeptide (TPR) repeat protein